MRLAPSTSLQTVWSPLCGQLLDSNGFRLSDVAQIELAVSSQRIGDSSVTNLATRG